MTGRTDSPRPVATAPRPWSPTIAAEHDLPYACIPAGTRNHFALDLGVDRDDVVGALDAFVDGGREAGRPGRGQRARLRQQRLARPSTPRRCRRTATATPRSAPCSTPSRRSSARMPRARRRDLRCAGTDGAAATSVEIRRGASWCPTTSTGSGARWARAPGRAWTPAGWASPDGTDRRGRRVPPLAVDEAQEFVIHSDVDIHVGVDGEALTMSTPWSSDPAGCPPGPHRPAAPRRLPVGRHAGGLVRDDRRPRARCVGGRPGGAGSGLGLTPLPGVLRLVVAHRAAQGGVEALVAEDVRTARSARA